MDRPYDKIPRQGEHHADDLDTEPTTNVRAQQPVYKPERTKATSYVHVLSADKNRGLYRLERVSPDEATKEREGFEEVARVPNGGDLGGLLERIPEPSRHAVFENTVSGSRHYDADRRLSKNWTDEGEFDRVTIFADAAEAGEFAESVKKDESAK